VERLAREQAQGSALSKPAPGYRLLLPDPDSLPRDVVQLRELCPGAMI
jgi:hypothetical protein